MRHPFQSIPKKRFRQIFLPLLILTLFLMVLLNFIGAPLTTTPAPYGIVSFELAGSLERAQQILFSWNSVDQLHAAFSLGLDYVFMLAYSVTIGLACVWAASVIRNQAWPLGSLGAPLAWSLGLAAFLDAVENIALVTLLFGTLENPWPQIAQWSAILKFGLVFLGLVYAFYGLIVRLAAGRE